MVAKLLQNRNGYYQQAYITIKTDKLKNFFLRNTLAEKFKSTFSNERERYSIAQ